MEEIHRQLDSALPGGCSATWYRHVAVCCLSVDEIELTPCDACVSLFVFLLAIMLGLGMHDHLASHRRNGRWRQSCELRDLKSSPTSLWPASHGSIKPTGPALVSCTATRPLVPR